MHHNARIANSIPFPENLDHVFSTLLIILCYVWIIDHADFYSSKRVTNDTCMTHQTE